MGCYCPRGCQRNIPYLPAHKCCHILVYVCLWSSATHITKDARPKIDDALLTLIFKIRVGSIPLSLFAIKASNTLFMTVFKLSPLQITQDTQPTIIAALLTLIFRMWEGSCVYFFWLLWRPIHRKWTVMYQCQYFTINSSISECDQKCETRNTEPEIRITRYRQCRQNPQIDGYGSGFGSPRNSGLGSSTGLEPDQAIFAVTTRTAGGLPEPIADTTYDDAPISPFPGCLN